MKTIAVFFGGDSNEREISVITGMMVVNLLRSTDNRVLPVYLPNGGGMTLAEKAKNVEDFISPDKKYEKVALLNGALVSLKHPRRKLAAIDCALNCCHGGMGEDGTLSALLAWNKIPSASPDMTLSSVFIDKTIAKCVLRGMGIPVLPSFAVNETEWSDRESVFEKVREFGYPVIVKPSKLGSSIGITVVREEESLSAALELAFALDDCALIEQYLPDRRDLNCAAYRLNGEIVLSSIEEVFSHSDILSFRDKYEGDAHLSQIPAEISPEIKERIGQILTEIYSAFRANGVVRADFLLSGSDVYFNELNTVPGSLAYYLFSESMTKARAFLLQLISEAKITAQKPPVATGILSRTDFGGAKRGKLRR